MHYGVKQYHQYPRTQNDYNSNGKYNIHHCLIKF